MQELRTHVSDRAQDRAGPREAGFSDPGNSKVGETWRAVTGEQDVGGFDVPVNDLEVMSTSERIGNLD